MPRSNEVTFAKICRKNAKPGYAVDKARIIRRKTIAKAANMIFEHIKYCQRKISEGWGGKRIKSFYIGKSFIKLSSHPGKDLQTTGFSNRFSDHAKKDHGRNGLIVVAVVTDYSIPLKCKEDRYITHQEEYALTLERRLIERCQDDPRLSSKLANTTTQPGKTGDQGNQTSRVYGVYFTYTLEGEAADSDDSASEDEYGTDSSDSDTDDTSEDDSSKDDEVTDSDESARETDSDTDNSSEDDTSSEDADSDSSDGYYDRGTTTDDDTYW